MATVFKAYDTRLEREAKSLGRLSHPNIVKVHDYGEYNGSPYLVGEKVVFAGTTKVISGWDVILTK